MDCDGDVDFDDIDDFVLGLTDPKTYESTIGFAPALKGDTDNDGDQDFDDIPGFVDLLNAPQRGSSPASVPEASTWILAVIGVLLLAKFRKR